MSSEAPKTVKLVMVRHGESAWNALNQFCGWFDAELSEAGKKEAAAAGKALKEGGWVFDAAHTSKLQRAQNTLNIILETMGGEQPEPAQTWRLNERHYGGLTGLNKTETVEKYGEAQVKIWRRSYDVPPLEMGEDHPYFESIQKDPRYADLSPEELPTCESLKLTIERALPYWNETIAPQLRAGKQVIIGAHGNSIRGIVKHIQDLSSEEIMGIEIPTGIPFFYELSLPDLKPTGTMQFLGDPEVVAAAQLKVANQGKKK